jgi:hypothetical protein
VCFHRKDNGKSATLFKQTHQNPFGIRSLDHKPIPCGPQTCLSKLLQTVLPPPSHSVWACLRR